MEEKTEEIKSLRCRDLVCGFLRGPHTGGMGRVSSIPREGSLPGAVSGECTTIDRMPRAHLPQPEEEWRGLKSGQRTTCQCVSLWGASGEGVKLEIRMAEMWVPETDTISPSSSPKKCRGRTQRGTGVLSATGRGREQHACPSSWGPLAKPLPTVARAA